MDIRAMDEKTSEPVARGSVACRHLRTIHIAAKTHIARTAMEL